VPKTVGYSLIENTQPEMARARATLAQLGVASRQVYPDTDLRVQAQDRPGLCAALAACRPRDVLAVPSLGRLALSMPDLEQMTDMIINAEVVPQHRRGRVRPG
jgi:DNA invertase Pin-like site-specific DNA recombinase